MATIAALFELYFVASCSQTPMSCPAANSQRPSGGRSESFSRRKFLRRSGQGLAVAALGTLGYTWRIEPHWVEIVRRPLPIERLPPSLIGRRLVQVSDIHVGTIVDQQFLLHWANVLGELEPDVLVVTGDFMTCHADEEVSRVAEVVREMPSPPLGRFGILGNHDYGDGWRQYRTADKLTAAMERLDLRVLRNEVVDVDGLQIAGMDDFYTKNFRPLAALRDLHADRAAIALCHNPDAMDAPVWDGYEGWVLAGHTHGGQCKAPFFTPPILPVKNRRYVAGEYVLDGGRRMYINRGLGYLRRVRFNARPEITVFTLTGAEV